MTIEAPVLIAGAGIGGLTLALALARSGIASIVLERSAAPEPVGAGIQLSPNAGRILDALGLGAQLDAVSSRPAAIAVANGRTGGSIAEIPLGAFAERRYGAPYRVLHRADLHAVLRAAAEVSGHIRLAFGTTVTRVRTSPGGAEIDTDGRGGPSTLSGGLIVGADGLRSTMAAHLGLPPAQPARVTAWRAMLPDRPVDGSKTLLWLSCGAHLVAYQVAKGTAQNLVLVVEDRAARESAAGAAPVRLADWADEPRRLIRTAAAWTPWPLFTRRATIGWAGPVTLLGDAAHPLLPFLAQGAALAIEDAAVLAAVLADPGRAPADAARAYERCRLLRWRRLQDEAARTGVLYHLGSGTGFARDAAMRLMPPALRLARYDWLFGWKEDEDIPAGTGIRLGARRSR